MTVLPQDVPPIRFTVAPGSQATAPPEARGLARDEVRLLVADPERVWHVRFRDLADALSPGDLLVVNTSGTLPAALDATRPGHAASPVHVATVLDEGSWVIEVRMPDNSGPANNVAPLERIDVRGGLQLEVQESYPIAGHGGSRLWRAWPRPRVDPTKYLLDHGRPIRYGYLSGAWPLKDLQTIFADEPGSAEMPSAGRPFTHRLLVRLMVRGVAVAPLVLHTGVSSPEKHEPPMPERFKVPEATARLVNATRAAGGRVVAVGTTVTRALETVAAADGGVSAGSGWTDLVLGPDRPARVVSGLVTGLHEAEASHLLLLEAVAGRSLVATAYDAAVAERYLWHEFGDTMLFLP
jgi:S-adenosylmethionine:tRNA ribosyltransferase-isomerase